MLKLELDPILAGYYGFNFKGSIIPSLLMDKTTPPIDLLVRESIQNSADAIRREENVTYGKIYFNLGSFNSLDLANSISIVGDNLKKDYGNKQLKYLAIKDKNTVGLMGLSDDKEGPNNHLYKLVYSFMESGKDAESGGSWGIGKSVYFNYGLGMVFYYSRTLENGKYIQKLCGSIIEDETKKETALLRNIEKSTGVAFIGKNEIDSDGETHSIPITDDLLIKEFLSIFGLSPYCESETGTTIIIPYFNADKYCGRSINDGYKPWDDDFVDSLKISIQRWYFARISNELYNGKFLKVFVNDELIVLNPFFKTLQQLYLKQIDGCEVRDITSNQGFDKPLGVFAFKKFSKEELDVCISPNRYPSPYIQLDIKESDDEKNDSIVFYLRKPGMVITYDDPNFTRIKTNPNEYIIGMFILNDDAKYKNETLGSYFKEGEMSNHKAWGDHSESKQYTQIVSLTKKPFRRIKNEINKILSEAFREAEPEFVITSNSQLQRKLAEILLPSEDVGKEKDPSNVKRRKKNQSDDPLAKLRKSKSTIKTLFDGFVDGKLQYTFQFLLKEKQKFVCGLDVVTSSKSQPLDNWESLGFTTPFYIDSLKISEYQINNSFYKKTIDLNFNQNSAVTKKTPDGKNDIFKIISHKTSVSRKCSEFSVFNYSNNEIAFTLKVFINPLDDTSSFSFDNKIEKIGGGNK